MAEKDPQTHGNKDDLGLADQQPMEEVVLPTGTPRRGMDEVIAARRRKFLDEELGGELSKDEEAEARAAEEAETHG